MKNYKQIPPLMGEARKGLPKRSIWGGCKRSLYGAPEIWEDVRLLAKSICESNTRDAERCAEHLLASVMCYAAYRVKLDISDSPAKVAICKFWEQIDEMSEDY